MDMSKSVLELIEIESADFASQVYDVMQDGNDFCKSTMVVIIDELMSDMIAQARDTTDQVKMLWVVHRASKALRDVMQDEEGEAK
jgi:hypothetical protein